MPNVDDLLRTLMRASTVLDDAQVRFALCGGLATYARGGSETEHDVDLLIKPTDRDRALDALAGAGFRTEHPEANWLVKAYDRAEDDLLLDLIYRPVDRPVTDANLDDAEPIAVGAVKVPVISGTQLMIHSLLMITPHECDFAPALDMIRSIREQIDLARVRSETQASPYARAFLFLAEELGLVERVHA